MSAADPSATERRCGTCSLCCTVLRVDELAKLGGRSCLHQRGGGGCRVHPDRPEVCRAYRCAWLAGAFGDSDRPDRLGALLDFVTRGDAVHLVVRQAHGDSPQLASRLQQIVADTRRSMPVEIRDVEDVLDADRAYRVLHPSGAEHRIEGDRLQVMEGGRVVEERRAPWLERCVRSLVEHVRARRLRRWPSHAERLARLGLPAREEPD